MVAPDTSPVPCELCGTEAIGKKPGDTFRCASVKGCFLATVSLPRKKWNALQSAIHAHAERRVEEAREKESWNKLDSDKVPTAYREYVNGVFEEQVETINELRSSTASAVSEAVEPLVEALREVRTFLDKMSRVTGGTVSDMNEVAGRYRDSIDRALATRNGYTYAPGEEYVTRGQGVRIVSILPPTLHLVWLGEPQTPFTMTVEQAKECLAPYHSRGGEGEKCPKCDSTDTYLSPAGYNSVQVCRACQSEWHKPEPGSLDGLINAFSPAPSGAAPGDTNTDANMPETVLASPEPEPWPCGICIPLDFEDDIWCDRCRGYWDKHCQPQEGK